MFQTSYFIDKSSNTFADNLGVFGLAFVLNQIADGRSQIRLEDMGRAFVVVCEPPIQPAWVEQCPFFAAAPFLVTFDNKSKQKMIKGTVLDLTNLPQHESDLLVDYAVEKQRRAEFFAQRESLSNEAKRALAQGKPHDELRGLVQPHMHWEVFRAVNPLSLQGYNSLMVEWWRAHNVFPELLKILLQMTAQTPNDEGGAEAAWANLCKKQGWDKPKKATAMQLFNPAQGKGVNNPKAAWRAPGNLNNFWLIEWLKAVGLFQAGITRVVANPRDPRNAKDRKTYVLIPVRLNWGTHREVMQDFQRAMAGSATAVQLDIYAALRYTKALLKHYESARVEDFLAELFGRSAGDLVGGMQMAFYKNLGQAAAVMNIANINLPRWVRPRSKEDLAQLQLVLDEHLTIVRTLDETKGEQFDLLCQYRDFLSANDLDPFFAFTTAYSGFIMSQRERGKFVLPFQTTTLEVLFMNSEGPDLRKIIQSEGFRNIAYAIRQATITAQFKKSNKEKFPVRYDVRYGLGQQLSRKANYRNEFVAELTDFLRLYNAENSQQLEDLSKRYGGNIPEEIRRLLRRSVKTTDIDEIISLIDEYEDSRLICNMLVAYGYAREPREPLETDTSNAQLSEEGSSEEESEDDDSTLDEE